MPRFKKGEMPDTGKPFQKGQSGNPKGKPPIPEDVKAMRKLTSAEFERACGRILFVEVDKLKDIADDPKEPVLDALIARILHKAIKECSRVDLNYFVERFLGKVPEGLNVSGNLNSQITDFIAARKKHQIDEE